MVMREDMVAGCVGVEVVAFLTRGDAPLERGLNCGVGVFLLTSPLLRSRVSRS